MIRTFIGYLLYFTGVFGIIVGIIAASEVELYGLTADLVIIAQRVLLGALKYGALGLSLALIGRLLIPREKEIERP